MTFTDFIELYESAIRKVSDTSINQPYSDCVLLRLLKANIKDITPIWDEFVAGNYCFQSPFRKWDVVDDGSGHTDMAIWYAIHASEIFWDLANAQVKPQTDSIEGD